MSEDGSKIEEEYDEKSNISRFNTNFYNDLFNNIGENAGRKDSKKVRFETVNKKSSKETVTKTRNLIQNKKIVDFIQLFDNFIDNINMFRSSIESLKENVDEIYNHNKANIKALDNIDNKFKEIQMKEVVFEEMIKKQMNN
jgi:hypothetical protein